MANSETTVRLDLNNPMFQDNLLTLQKPERHAALEALHKIRQLTWNQLYRDPGLKREKITSIWMSHVQISAHAKQQPAAGWCSHRSPVQVTCNTLLGNSVTGNHSCQRNIRRLLLISASACD